MCRTQTAMPVETSLLPGLILEGRYGVVAELGVGGTNRIYEGRQTNLGQPVMIKTLAAVYDDPTQAKQQVEQVALEARILAALNHPNLLTVHDCFQYEGLPIIVSELVEGRRLSEVVELAPKVLSAKRVLVWAEQLLDVLAYLHAREPSIIVRDVKPSNIILGRDGRLRLVDFSLAKRMADRGKGTHEIVRGVGADGYAPVEQIAYGPSGPPTDLYSLGATLYHLLTKLHPPSAGSRAIAAKEMLEDAREINETVDDRLWEALLRLLAIRPQDRPQSALEAKELLFPQATPVARPESAQRRCVDCGVALEQQVRQGVEIDCCRRCGGIWLDRDELERLVELGLEDRQPETVSNAPTQRLDQVTAGSLRVGDLDLPATSRVWQFLRDVWSGSGLNSKEEKP